MALQNSLGNWEEIDHSYFLLKDSLDQYEYEIWYHPKSYPFDPPAIVPFDSSIECYNRFFDLQLIVKEQNVPIDCLLQPFKRKWGLGVGEEENSLLLSQQYRLFQNYPNPFNPVTNIQFFLLKGESVKIEIFDLMGKKIGILLNSEKSAGFHTLEFDGSSLASGIYFYRLQTDQFVDAKKMILMK